MSPTKPIETRVAELVGNILDSSASPDEDRFHDVVDALSTEPGFEEAGSSLVFRNCEYEVYVGGSGRLKEVIRNLESIEDLSLSMAPRTELLMSVGGQSGLLLLRYHACPGEHLTRASETTSPFQLEARNRFRQEMKALVDRGLVHTYARSPYHWLVSDRTGTLVLDGWESLQRCDPQMGAEMLERIDGILSERDPSGPGLFHDAFCSSRVLLPVIHPIGWAKAMDNVRLVHDAGVKGIFLIDQGMSEVDVLRLVIAVREQFPELWIGLNLLGHRPAVALRRALDVCEGCVDGLWADNAGIDEHADAQPVAEEFLRVREKRGWDGLYFGGVAFKYQRQVAEDDLGRAAILAQRYVDVVCTTGPATGREADVSKVIAMRAALGPDVPLALASGVTVQNVGNYLPYVNAYLVGTGIEESFGVLDRRKVAQLQQAIAEYPSSP